MELRIGGGSFIFEICVSVGDAMTIVEIHDWRFWILTHPFEMLLFIVFIATVLYFLPNWISVWTYHGFYPFKYDYTNICIGGGCP